MYFGKVSQGQEGSLTLGLGRIKDPKSWGPLAPQRHDAGVILAAGAAGGTHAAVGGGPVDLVVRADEGLLRLQRVGEGSHVQGHDVGGLLHLPAVEQSVHQSHRQVALGTEIMNSATEGRQGREVALSGMTHTDLEFTGIEQLNKFITAPSPTLPTIEAYGSAQGEEIKFLKMAALQYLSGTPLML